MLAKRIIPCLDVTNGRVVKGIDFIELRGAGDPVETAHRYDEQGADKVTFLDITAIPDGHDLVLSIIEVMASQVSIPLTVGGGVRALEDVRQLLNVGADKISINSSAVTNPQLVSDASTRHGAQYIIVAIDAKKASVEGEAPRWEVFTYGGRKGTGLDAVAWAREMAQRDAGEILLTNTNRGDTKAGLDLELTRVMSDAAPVPVIASGDMGSLQHLADDTRRGCADAMLVASIFYYGECTVGQAKQLMAGQAIPVRIGS